jgi:Helix-turn-helix domain
MAKDINTKAAALKLLRRGVITQSEASKLAGISRQLVRYWVKDMPDARPGYLARLWSNLTTPSQKD